MHRTMNIWVVIIACACIMAGFFWYNNTLSVILDEQVSGYEQSKVNLAKAQGEQAELRKTIEELGTDAFVEDTARKEYGYMMPNEIRFVITNPEVLYGDEEIPSP